MKAKIETRPSDTKESCETGALSQSKLANVGSDGLANSRASLKNIQSRKQMNIFQAAATWERDVPPRKKLPKAVSNLYSERKTEK